MGTATSKVRGAALEAAKSVGSKVAAADAVAANAAASKGPLSIGSVITSSSQASAATGDKKKEEYEEIMRRVNQRPGLFRRLDESDADVGSGKPTGPGTQASKEEPKEDQGSPYKTRLPTIDAEAAEIAKNVKQQLSNRNVEPHHAAVSSGEQETSPSSTDVSVTRLKPSRRIDEAALEAARELSAQRDAAVLQNLTRMLGPLPRNGEMPPPPPRPAADHARATGAAPAATPAAGKVVSLAELAGEEEEEPPFDDGGSKRAHAESKALGSAGLTPEILSEHDRKMRIQSGPDYDSPGARSFAVYEAMQLNPKILDTSAAIASSPALLIAAQMAAGIVPPSAQGDTFLALPAGTTREDADGGIIIPGGVGAGVKQLAEEADAREAKRRKLITDGSATTASSDAGDDDGDEIFSSLVAMKASSMDALVPVDRTIDQLLLAKEPEIPKGMTKWGPRPPESSAYDQLILQPEEEEFALERGELFELYARHKADPDYWTAERLADKYDTKVEWVEVLLQYASPPLFVQVDGEPYGVYAIRSYADLHAQDAAAIASAKATAEAAAAAAGAASEEDEHSNARQVR